MGTPVTFEGLSNARDLGAMKAADGRLVKNGLLYRSDQLFFASEADRAKLGELGIGLIIDFRSTFERETQPDCEIEGAQNLHLPVIRDVRAGITQDKESHSRIMALFMEGEEVSPAFVDEYMRNTYRSFVEDPDVNAQYARFIDAILAMGTSGKASLWHCTAGKDRAGFASAVLLAALGVSKEDIVTDYLQTNACVAGVLDHVKESLAEKLPNAQAISALERFFLADEEFLEAAFDAARERYGSFERFLEEAVSIDDNKREELRRVFLA